LKNEEATRFAILQAFQFVPGLHANHAGTDCLLCRTHFIDNPKIIHGDPLIFYYAGHGTRTQAPSSWPIASKDVYDARREIEMILPYDSVRDPRELRRDGEVSGIPDRTLGSLLRKTSAKHGQNITVILDCCASGHGTRAVSSPRNFSVRSVDAAFVGRVMDETDSDIWGDDHPPPGRRGPYLRGAFVDRQDDTHVLLAACGRKEDSHGTDEGGWFTTALINALKDPSIHPRSYAEILKHIRATFSYWYSSFDQVPPDQRPEPQNPQCEGMNRDRVIFQNTAIDRRSFPVRAIHGRPGHCEVQVGDVYGIQPGTIFELRQVSPFTSHQPVVGSATAVEISPGTTVARIADHTSIHFQGLIAYVTNIPNQLRFAVVNDHPDSQSATALFRLLNERLQSMSKETAALCTQVENEKEAELIFRVQPQRVELDRRDVQMSCLNTARPYMDAADVGLRFPEVMGWFARFNFHIQRENSFRPFHDDIEMRLHLLKKPEGQSTTDHNDDEDNDHQEYMVPGQEIFFNNMEAIVSQDEAIYCLVLHNHSKQPLFPYVVRLSMLTQHLTTTDARQFHFDPATYTVELFYAPISPHEAPLKPGGELQLGRSSESMTAMSFFVTDGQELDTGFLKVGPLDGLRRLDTL
jgi:hypothetical protein